MKQPDLDWRNPKVRKAMYGVMRFWLDRGVDGFRIDALSYLIKDEQLRDNPPNPGWRPGDPPWARQRRVYSDDRPEILDVVREMRAVMDAYEGDRASIGELYRARQAQGARSFGVGDEGEVLCSTHLDRIGNFDLKELDLRSDEGILVTLESGA